MPEPSAGVATPFDPAPAGLPARGSSLPPGPPIGVKRELTLLDAVGIGVNGIVGSGIYLLVAPLARVGGGSAVFGLAAVSVGFGGALERYVLLPRAPVAVAVIVTFGAINCAGVKAGGFTS